MEVNVKKKVEEIKTNHFQARFLDAGEWGYSSEKLDHCGEGWYHLLPISDEAKDWLNASEFNKELNCPNMPRSFVHNCEKYGSLYALRFAHSNTFCLEHVKNMCNLMTDCFVNKYLPMIPHLKNGVIQKKVAQPISTPSFTTLHFDQRLRATA